VNVPVGLFVLLATVRIVPESRAPDSKRAFDAAGATLVTAGLGMFVFAIVKSETYGWSSGLTWGASRRRSRSHCCVLGTRAAKLRSAYAAGDLSHAWPGSGFGHPGAHVGRRHRHLLLRLVVPAAGAWVSPVQRRTGAAHLSGNRRRRNDLPAKPSRGSALAPSLRSALPLASSACSLYREFQSTVITRRTCLLACCH
jgi:hypothetical protein